MYADRRASTEPVREDRCGRGRCDFCGKVRGLFARRGIQCCAVCHASRREVNGRYVWGPEAQTVEVAS